MIVSLHVTDTQALRFAKNVLHNEAFSRECLVGVEVPLIRSFKLAQHAVILSGLAITLDTKQNSQDGRA